MSEGRVLLVMNLLWMGPKAKAWVPRATAQSWAGAACEDERGAWNGRAQEAVVNVHLWNLRVSVLFPVVDGPALPPHAVTQCEHQER